MLTTMEQMTYILSWCSTNQLLDFLFAERLPKDEEESRRNTVCISRKMGKA